MVVPDNPIERFTIPLFPYISLGSVLWGIYIILYEGRFSCSCPHYTSMLQNLVVSGVDMGSRSVEGNDAFSACRKMRSWDLDRPLMSRLSFNYICDYWSNRISCSCAYFGHAYFELLQYFVQTNETPAKIFLINCLCAIQQPLLRHDIASEYVKKLGEMIETQIHGLVEKEVDTILRRCGLSNKMSYFRNDAAAVSTEPLAELEDTAPASLSDGLKAFFGLILGSENALPEFEQMQVPRLRSEATVQVARTLAEVYELIYKAVMDPANRYPDPKSLARHPPDQIRTILGI